MSRKGIMLCYPFEQKRLAKWEPPYLVQPKLDGERCRAFAGYAPENKVVLLSSEENQIYSVPHIDRALRELNFCKQIESDGELYTHGLPFESIHSIVGRTKNLHPDYKRMEYHIFDMVSQNPQIERIAQLNKLAPLLKPDSPIKIVPTHVAESFDQVMEIYDLLIEDGYEGMIVRHLRAPYLRRRSIMLMKFKPKKSDIYKIVGWKEEVSINGVPKGRLGALTCKGDDGSVFSVGSGLNDEAREILWNKRDSLPGRFCKVQYQHITSGKGVPRFPIFLSIWEEPYPEMVNYGQNLPEGGESDR